MTCPICMSDAHDAVPVPELTINHAPVPGAEAFACAARGWVRWRLDGVYYSTAAVRYATEHGAGDGWVVRSDGDLIGITVDGAFGALGREAAADLGRHLVAAFGGGQ